MKLLHGGHQKAANCAGRDLLHGLLLVGFCSDLRPVGLYMFIVYIMEHTV